MTRRPLRLDCLGSGFAFSGGAYWNGWLLDGRVLLDCPAQALPHLYRLGHDPAAIDLVLLSHAHGDHVAGVDALLLDLTHRHAGRRASPPVFVAPPGVRERIVEIVGDHDHAPRADRAHVRWLDGSDGEALSVAGVHVEPVATVHSLPSLGYRVSLDGTTVAYTGDTAPGPHVLRLAAGADALIIECGGAFPGVHCDWPDVLAIRRALPAETEVIVTHYDPATAPDVSAIAGLRLARDLERYTV